MARDPQKWLLGVGAALQQAWGWEPRSGLILQPPRMCQVLAACRDFQAFITTRVVRTRHNFPGNENHDVRLMNY